MYKLENSSFENMTVSRTLKVSHNSSPSQQNVMKLWQKTGMCFCQIKWCSFLLHLFSAHVSSWLVLN